MLPVPKLLLLNEEKIKIDRLKPEIKGRFKYLSCSICNHLLPLNKSEACDKCGKQYCSECINNKINTNDNKCPNINCNSEYKSMILLESFKEELGELEIKCRFEDCSIFTEYKKLNEHEINCEHKQIKCPGCDKNFKEEIFKTHSASCSDNLFPCVSCGFKANIDDFLKHCCQVFLFINKQIHEVYQKEREQLKETIKKEVMNEVEEYLNKHISKINNEKELETISDNKSNNINSSNESVSSKLFNDLSYNEIDNSKFLKRKTKSSDDNSNSEPTPHVISTRRSRVISKEPKIKLGNKVNKFKTSYNISYMILKKEEDEIIFGTYLGEIICFSISQSKGLKKYNEHNDKILCLMETLDGHGFLSSSRDKTIRLWNHNEEKKSIFHIINDDFNTNYILVMENYFITGDYDGRIRIYDIKTGKKSIPMKSKNSTEDKNNIKPINIEIDNCHKDKITCLTMIDENFILSGSADNYIFLWNLNRFKIERKYEPHKTKVMSIQKYQNDKFISCSIDGNIRLYNIFNNEKLKALYNTNRSLRDLSPSINNFIICAKNKKLRVLNIDKEDVVSEKETNETISKVIFFEKEKNILTFKKNSTCF